MIPIRDAFNQIGHQRFSGEWTGDEIALLHNWPTSAILSVYSPGERAAFDRCTVVITYLTQELEAGRAVAVTTDARHRQHDVAAEHWRDSAYDGRWQDGRENLAECLTDRGTSRFIRFPAVKAIPRAKPGPKPKADWDAYKLVFLAECAEGMPGDDHPTWDSKAAAVEWLRNIARDDPASKYKSADDVPFETARDHINRWLEECAAKSRN